VLGATHINSSCRGLASAPARRRRLLVSVVPPARVTTVPRVSISYLLVPQNVPAPPGPDSIDKFVARYGAENATINPDMAEAEVNRQVSKLSELAVSTNSTVADAAKKALQAYSQQIKAKAEEDAAVISEEAAFVAGGPPKAVFPLRKSIHVGEFASLTPTPRVKLENLDTLPDVRRARRPRALLFPLCSFLLCAVLCCAVLCCAVLCFA
jgi:hypothetical protein